MGCASSYLTEDEKNPDSNNDFGMNIIPAMLADGKRMFAYPFRGYWKDVGTINSLWEGNMDLIAEPPKLDMYDKRSASTQETSAPRRITSDALRNLENPLTEGAHVNGLVRHSIISTNAVVRRDAEVIDSVIMPGAVIDRGAKVYRAIIGVNTVVGKNAVVGEDYGGFTPEQLPPVTVVGSECAVPDGETVAPGQMVGNDVYPKIDGNGKEGARRYDERCTWRHLYR